MYIYMYIYIYTCSQYMFLTLVHTMRVLCSGPYFPFECKASRNLMELWEVLVVFMPWESNKNSPQSHPPSPKIRAYYHVPE